jgi:hypothetical protein
VLDYNTYFKTANLISTLYAPDEFRVSDHDPVIVGLTPNDPPTVDAGGPYTVDEGSSVTLTATGADPNGDALTYAWDLDNDGSFETAGQSVSFAGVDGPAAFTVKAQVTDPLGLTAVAEATVTVNNVAPTVTLDSANVYTWNESSVAQREFRFTASDAAGENDPLTVTADCGTGGALVTGSVTASNFECVFADGPSTSTVSVSVDDGDGGTAQATQAVTVANVAPSVTASFSASTVACAANNPTLSVAFSDPSALDTHTASIAWGDGNTQSVAPASSPFSLQHTFALAGKYTTTATVTDDDNGSGSDTKTVTVNYTSSGFLQPINPDGTSVFKYNSTIPVKIRFQDCNNSYPSNLAPTIKVTLVSSSPPGAAVNEPVLSSSADVNGVMRWTGAPDNQYIYNLSTKTLSDSTATYLITVTVPATGQTQTVKFGLR